MKIVRDNRLEAFQRIEHLLYGINYEVWFNLYGPSDPNQSLNEALRNLVSKECVAYRLVPSTPEEAKSEIMDRVLYEGHVGAGPIELESKKCEIIELMKEVFSRVNLKEAEMVVKFEFKEGQPSYPVFWDFAYDIHSQGLRNILVGSSSD